MSKIHQIQFSPGAIAAAGSSQSDATELPGPQYSEAFIVVTGADDAKGVRLPEAVANGIGEGIIIYNEAAADLFVYPDANGAINGGSADAPIEMAPKSMGIFIANSATNWAAMFTAGTPPE